MYDIAREPMQPSEELGNESEITLELFGFVKQLAMTSLSPTARLETVIPRRQMPQAAKIQPRHLRKGGASTVSGQRDTNG